VQPSPAALTGLDRLLEASVDGNVEIQLREPLRYGEEDQLADWLSREDPASANGHAVLFTLSATPEAENHGAVIATFRDWAKRGVFVVVDESEYVTRIQGDATLQARLDERRELWRGFVRRFGVGVLVANLERTGAGTAPDAGALDAVREVLGAQR
jgi:hypothetical protein